MSYDSEVLADSPAVYEDHQDTTGTAAVDHSGNSLDGTYNGTYVLNDSTDPACPAALGKHVRIDGTSGYFNANTTGWFTPATAGFTFEGWFYIRSWSNWMRLWDFANGTSDDIYLAANNAGTMTLKCNGGTMTFPLFTTTTWLHVVATVTTAGAATVWVNNSVWASGTVGVPLNQTRANKWTGRSAHSGDPYLAGSVTREAFYNSVLSSSRVGVHYAAGVGGGTASLSLSGSAVASLPPSGSGSLTLSGSGVGAGGASATAALTLSASTATPIQNYHGDTSNMLGGLDLGGGATVTVTRPVANLPGHLSYGPKVDVAVALPAPTLVNGRPT